MIEYKITNELGSLGNWNWFFASCRK